RRYWKLAASHCSRWEMGCPTGAGYSAPHSNNFHVSLALVFDNTDPESIKMLCFAAVATHRSPQTVNLGGLEPGQHDKSPGRADCLTINFFDRSWQNSAKFSS